MTGRAAARDELEQAIHAADWGCGHGGQASAAELADALLSRGYRRSVTAEEIGEAAADIAQSDGHVLNMQEWPVREMYRANACAAARAFGLEVTE